MGRRYPIAADYGEMTRARAEATAAPRGARRHARAVMRRVPDLRGARGQAPRPPSYPLRPFSHRLASPRARRERDVHVGCRAVRSAGPCCCASKTTIASAHVPSTSGRSSTTWRGWASNGDGAGAATSARVRTPERARGGLHAGAAIARGAWSRVCVRLLPQADRAVRDRRRRRAAVPRHVPRASDCRRGPAQACALRLEPGVERFEDALMGAQAQDPAAQSGDLLIRDRLGSGRTSLPSRSMTPSSRSIW